MSADRETLAQFRPVAGAETLTLLRWLDANMPRDRLSIFGGASGFTFHAAMTAEQARELGAALLRGADMLEGKA